VKAATYHPTITRLFKRASELVVAHSLTSTEFKGHPKPRDMLSIKRSQYADRLVAEFRDDIQVEGYPTFG